MLNDRQKKIVEKLGIDPKGFEPSEKTTTERVNDINADISDIQDALIELAELIVEG